MRGLAKPTVLAIKSLTCHFVTSSPVPGEERRCCRISAALIVSGDTTAALPLAGIIDMDAEKKRLAKAIEGANSDLGKMDPTLSNPSFVERAKPEAIAEARARKAELEAEIKRFSVALQRLG